MKWRVFREPRPLALAPETCQYRAWLSENTEIVEADRKFVTTSGTLQFMNELPRQEAEAIELCGESCKNGKPCVRRKGHGINKRWGHMSQLAPKKEERADMIGIRDFPHGFWADCEWVKE